MIHKKILLAVTCNTGRETYLIPFAHSLINNTRNLSDEYELEVHVFGGLSIDLVRTSAANYALKHKFDALVFFDDDMILPPHALNTLVNIWEQQRIPIVSGVYTSKTMPYHAFIYPIDGNDWLQRYEPNVQYKVKSIATGCLLVDTQVFRMLPKPWFLLKRDLNGYITSTEDCYFGNLCHSVGFEMIVDTSIECQHLKLVAFPSFFDSQYHSYENEWRPKKIVVEDFPRNKGPIIIHPLEGTKAQDGLDECAHLHQYPVPVNANETPLWRCVDCGLISTGRVMTGANVLNPYCCAPDDLEKLVEEMDDLE